MNINDAVDVIRREAQRSEALTMAADVLQRIGSLEQAEAERQAKLGKVVAQIEQAQRDLVAANKQVADTVSKGASDLQKLQVQARDILHQAEVGAGEITTESEARAKEIIKNAEITAGKVVDIGQGELAGVQADKDAAEKALAGVKAELAARSAELTDVAGRLAAAREAAAAMLR